MLQEVSKLKTGVFHMQPVYRSCWSFQVTRVFLFRNGVPKAPTVGARSLQAPCSRSKMFGGVPAPLARSTCPPKRTAVWELLVRTIPAASEVIQQPERGVKFVGHKACRLLLSMQNIRRYTEHSSGSRCFSSFLLQLEQNSADSM